MNIKTGTTKTTDALMTAAIALHDESDPVQREILQSAIDAIIEDDFDDIPEFIKSLATVSTTWALVIAGASMARARDVLAEVAHEQGVTDIGGRTPLVMLGASTVGDMFSGVENDDDELLRLAATVGLPGGEDRREFWVEELRAALKVAVTLTVRLSELAHVNAGEFYRSFASAQEG